MITICYTRRVCINNGRSYECNLSYLSFWAQLSVWWVRQLPNHLLQGCSSLHTDTAFMFIIGGLLTVKVLQSRHPDINAYAFLAFFCFAIVIFLTMIGIVSGTCRVANKIFAPPLFPSISHN